MGKGSLDVAVFAAAFRLCPRRRAFDDAAISLLHHRPRS
jgi:hypothetical protein